MAEFIEMLSKQSKAFINSQDLYESQVKVLRTRMDVLENQFKALLSLTKNRRVVLENTLSFYQV
jgi:hypothetical protein